MDPELGIDVVSLGLVYDATLEGDQAHVVMTMTSPACPMGEMILQDARSAVESTVPGVSHADFELVYEPRWTPDRMTDEAKQKLGYPEQPGAMARPAPAPRSTS